MQSLSIIIPVYNEEKTLLDVLNKVKKLHTICDLEVIIVNDGSSDKSKEIIDNNENLFSKAIHLNN